MNLSAYTHGVILDLSRRGKPTANAAIKSFNRRSRLECLNVHWLLRWRTPETKMETWRQGSNGEPSSPGSQAENANWREDMSLLLRLIVLCLAVSVVRMQIGEAGIGL